MNKARQAVYVAVVIVAMLGSPAMALPIAPGSRPAIGKKYAPVELRAMLENQPDFVGNLVVVFDGDSDAGYIQRCGRKGEVTRLEYLEREQSSIGERRLEQPKRHIWLFTPGQPCLRLVPAERTYGRGSCYWDPEKTIRWWIDKVLEQPGLQLEFVEAVELDHQKCIQVRATVPELPGVMDIWIAPALRNLVLKIDGRDPDCGITLELRNAKVDGLEDGLWELSSSFTYRDDE